MGAIWAAARATRRQRVCGGFGVHAPPQHEVLGVSEYRHLASCWSTRVFPNTDDCESDEAEPYDVVKG